ncbi:MAG: EamA family transporter [Nanoarchaeota archaeon]|nr:EamA family transporter [Nanoarchaeota archaeon]
MIERILSIVLVLVSGFYGALAPIYLKKGLKELERSGKLFSVKACQNVLIGVFIFGSGLLPLIIALKFSDLSLLYPLTGLSYAWTAIYSAYFLKEKVNKYTWAGIAFTVSGVFLIGVSAFGL